MVNNPIKNNRLVVDKTFATRLLKLALSIKATDACSSDEKESFISYAEKLLEYQCKTAVDADEIAYLKRVGWYDEILLPLMTTHDGIDISKSDVNKIVYSCLIKPNVGDQVLQYAVGRFVTGFAEIKATRLYFDNIENCKHYIDMHTPIFSKQDLIDKKLADSIDVNDI